MTPALSLRNLILATCIMFGCPMRPALAAPDEEALGKSAGYPSGTRSTWLFDERLRVGSFSNLDGFLPHNTLVKSANPRTLPAAKPASQIKYRFEGRTLSLDDFLARQRVTGLLIIKDGKILAERYQYDRNPAHRFVSFSMAKSIVSLAVGLALQEGKIGALDDPASKYVRDLAGTGYGEASIRNLLRMASGVRFSEKYDGRDDLAKFFSLRSAQGSIQALRAFTERDAEQGTRFHYATSETVALTAVIREATGSTLSEYLTARLWQPMGAEADATWIKNVDGLEVGGSDFNAILRDYGRLGLLLANDGMIGNTQVVPRDYLLEATDWRRQPATHAPGKATPYFGYGYQFWTFPGERRRFALLGIFGQSIFVDPNLKLIMVITAAARNALVGKETLGPERNALWRGLVGMFGPW
jgi:CubicO group peptidase (beta-lactamase class C family)